MGEIPAEYQQFDDQVRSGIRMRNRTFIISQFLYFVHPLCREYSYINHLAAHYPTMQSARNDWAWRLPGSTDHIINSKIVTSREAEVFIKLGQLLHEKVHLTSVVKKGLYSAFLKVKTQLTLFLICLNEIKMIVRYVKTLGATIFKVFLYPYSVPNESGGFVQENLTLITPV